jgi:GGDEF domain-containing protein
MRASDVVGMLGEGEIGFLLHGTTGEQAETAARRLEKMLAGEDPTLRSALSIGMATRVPGLLASGGIVDEAREKAGERERASRSAGPSGTMP